MKILIQQVHIADPASALQGQIQDILIEDGLITRIARDIPAEADQVINANGWFASPGWVDPFANFCDPGYEYKETLESGAKAAAAGGFTVVMVVPNTKPVIDSKAQVEYIVHKSAQLPVHIIPIGAVSKNTEGRELAEMYDMRNSGALAFSDGTKPVQSSGLLLKAFQYVKAFDGVIIQIPDDTSIGVSGLMNEGIVSTRLGLPGKPVMAEELVVARDIKLARYADSKVHFTGVTSPKSLEYIRRAKDAGLPVSCSVTPYHLFFTDEDLANYDTNLKVYPPLRTTAARNALRDAVIDGTIDCIATHHMPHEFDSKIIEFEYARNGMTGLETAYAAVQTSIPSLSPLDVARLFSTNARSIFGIRSASIEEKGLANITLFNPHEEWRIDFNQWKSKSRNTAFEGKMLRGRTQGIISAEKVFLNK